MLRQHFPQAIEVDAQGRIRINASALQLGLDPANPAGVQVEEAGFELSWVGKCEAYTFYASRIADDKLRQTG